MKAAPSDSQLNSLFSILWTTLIWTIQFVSKFNGIHQNRPLNPTPTTSSSGTILTRNAFHFAANLLQLISCYVLTPRKIDIALKTAVGWQNKTKKIAEIKTRKRMYRTRARTLLIFVNLLFLFFAAIASLRDASSRPAVACMQVNTLMGCGFLVYCSRSGAICCAIRVSKLLHIAPAATTTIGHAIDSHERENEYHGNGF